MYRKMLVLLDGSELSEVVFPYAIELATGLELEVVLFNVHDSEEAETPLYQAYIDHKVDIMRHQIEEKRQKVGGERGAKAAQVYGKVVTGHPAEEILRYAEENIVDVILMSTHGRSGIRRWVLGSVAEKVLQASKVPVWLVRAGIHAEVASDRCAVKAMLVPLDGSKPAEAVLPHVKTLAKQGCAGLVEVVLFGVSEPLVESGYYIPDVLTKPEELKKYLDAIGTRLKDANIRVRSEVRKGNPAEQIIEYAKENPFDLIVMSTHGRSGLGRWVFGSVADKVLHTASIPVFIVRPQ